MHYQSNVLAVTLALPVLTVNDLIDPDLPTITEAGVPGYEVTAWGD